MFYSIFWPIKMQLNFQKNEKLYLISKLKNNALCNEYLANSANLLFIKAKNIYVIVNMTKIIWDIIHNLKLEKLIIACNQLFMLKTTILSSKGREKILVFCELSERAMSQ